MPCPNLAGVLGVVRKILCGEHPVFVADEAIGPDLRRIKVDLDLDVLRDRHERAHHLLDKDLASFEQRVDIVIVAVAFVGDPFHLRVLDVARAEAEDGQEHARFRLLGREVFEGLVVAKSDVEVAVGAKDHTVGSALHEVLGGDLVSERDPRSSCRRAAGSKLIDRRGDFRLVQT